MTAITMKARPTTYSGIKMRSRLEALFAEELDQWGIGWTYEPECFAGPGGQYLPDFKLDIEGFDIATNDPEADEPTGCLQVGLPRLIGTPPMRGSVYVEVKPSVPAVAETLAERMCIIRASEPDAHLLVATPDVDYLRWADGDLWTSAARLAQCCVCRRSAFVMAPILYELRSVGPSPTLLCPYCTETSLPGTAHLHRIDFDFRWRGGS